MLPAPFISMRKIKKDISTAQKQISIPNIQKNNNKTMKKNRNNFKSSQSLKNIREDQKALDKLRKSELELEEVLKANKKFYAARHKNQDSAIYNRESVRNKIKEFEDKNHKISRKKTNYDYNNSNHWN